MVNYGFPGIRSPPLRLWEYLRKLLQSYHSKSMVSLVSSSCPGLRLQSSYTSTYSGASERCGRSNKTGVGSQMFTACSDPTSTELPVQPRGSSDHDAWLVPRNSNLRSVRMGVSSDPRVIASQCIDGLSAELPSTVELAYQHLPREILTLRTQTLPKVPALHPVFYVFYVFLARIDPNTGYSWQNNKRMPSFQEYSQIFTNVLSHPRCRTPQRPAPILTCKYVNTTVITPAVELKGPTLNQVNLIIYHAPIFLRH
jgi:hypothetical protein